VNNAPPVDEPLSFSLRRVPNINTYKAQRNESEPLPLVSGFDDSIDTGYYTVTPGDTWDDLKKYKKFTSERYKHSPMESTTLTFQFPNHCSKREM
jgi:hypothetical protein